MRETQLLTDELLAQFVTITANAYPGIKLVTDEEKERTRDRMAQLQKGDEVHYYGLVEDDVLLGGMRFHDYRMKLRSAMTLVGGLGGVAVDLAHKKQKVARDMVQFFLQHYRERGACLTALYPFRPDFYRRMGFGYGSKMSQYRVSPASLPAHGDRMAVSFLTDADKAGLNACYGRFLAQTNGLMEKQTYALDGMFKSQTLKLVGYKSAGELQGYASFDFKMREEGNFLWQDIIIHELVYENRTALAALLAFLHTQADQVDRIVFNTQDDNLHFLFGDPRNDSNHIIPSVWHESNTQGIGIMYRVIDVPRLFAVLADHNFNGQSCRFTLSLADSLLPENGGEYGVLCVNGRITLTAPQPDDVVVSMDIAEFSSLITGAIGFNELYQFNLADISDVNLLETINQLFWTAQKPLCLTSF
ncbi:MAG: GNAT family N-acetyltransferase [Ardenticatenaceae bacterium]|nr:GNAT family N-acetyltransferase [Ardenticatenaceae bacterium]